MPLPSDSLSFLGCVGHSHLQQQALLRTHKDTPLHASSPLQVHCNIAVETSKAVFRLKKQGIEPTPKILHHVKKKEAWKARRRERKEKEKADRVTDPVWYAWSEEDGLMERSKLSMVEAEEDGADEFLCFVREQRPSRRIVVNGGDAIVEASTPPPSAKQKVATVRKTGSMREMGRRSLRSRWASQSSCGDRLAKLDMEDWNTGQREGLHGFSGNKTGSTKAPYLNEQGFVENPNPKEQDFNVVTAGSNNGAIPYTFEECKCELEADVNCRIAGPHTPKKHELKHGTVRCTEGSTRNSVKNEESRQVTDISLYKAAPQLDHICSPANDVFSHAPIPLNDMFPHAPTRSSEDVFQQHSQHRVGSIIKYPLASEQLPTSRKEIQTERIEKFVDDEIQVVPKGPEVWMKGVGIVKSKKPPFSKEFKEMILSRRKGDWKVLYDSAEEDVDTDGDAILPSQFDGRSALSEDKKIQKLAARLNETNYWTSKVHFAKVMHSGRMKLTEDRVLRIVQILGEWGNWRRAMQVVQWVHKRQRYQFHKSKFVLTTLLSVLGKAQRPVEALNVFNVMRERFSSYPDMAAYHAIAVILGQAGHLKKLLQLIESLKIGPPKPIKFIPLIKWDSSLHPDIVVYNAVLNACIPTKEWMGVSWTWEQIEKLGIKPNGATFGLTIEAMVKAGNFDQAIRYYRRMERAGFPPSAQTYKCLVEAFGKARKADEAVELVKEMEASGTVASASVYFALACSLCIAGRLKEALVQVRKMQDIPSRKSDVITYTGLIQTCHKVGRTQDAIFLFEHMQHTCAPNVRTCNEMIKIYGRNRMFEEAKSIYEAVKKGWLDSCIHFENASRLFCDSLTFELMLKAVAVSEKWDYFDGIYKDMTSRGYHLSGKTSLWVMVEVAKLKKIDLVDDMMHRLQKTGNAPDSSLYEVQILSCLQEKCVQKALNYLNDMIRHGYEVLSTMHVLQKQVQKETWDSFLQQAGSLEGFKNLNEETAELFVSPSSAEDISFGLKEC